MRELFRKYMNDPPELTAAQQIGERVATALFAGAIFGFYVFVLYWLFCGPAAANALRQGFPYDQWHSERAAQTHRRPARQPRADRAPRERHAERDERRSYPEPELSYARDDSDGRQCLNRTRVVGSQWATEQGAEDSAKKAFMEDSRFRYGEQYMDIERAEDYVKRCSRSSVGELAGQVLYRCEIVARPCRPGFAREGMLR